MRPVKIVIRLCNLRADPKLRWAVRYATFSDVTSHLFLYLGILYKDGYNYRRTDVDREITIYMDTLMESESLLFDENLNLCGDPELCKALAAAHDEDFIVNTIFNMRGPRQAKKYLRACAK